MARFDAAIEAARAGDPVAQGRFTRAYVDVCSKLDPETDVPGWRMLTIALIAEPNLKVRWREWVNRRAQEFAETDASPNCVLVRFAADGLWLADLMQSHELDAKARVALADNLKALSAR
ncbi:hypothetical protein D3C87_1854840 [compost metagenome]